MQMGWHIHWMDVKTAFLMDLSKQIRNSIHMSGRGLWIESRTSCLPLIYIQHYPFMITGFCFHTTSKSFLLQKTNTSIHGDCRYRCFRSCCKLPGFRWLAVRFTIRLLDVECYTNVLPQVFPRKSLYLFHVN